jgi:hypothetical protein
MPGEPLGEKGDTTQCDVARGPVKLAEPKPDRNNKLESHHLKGAMKQVVDKDDPDAAAGMRSMVEKASEARGGKTSPNAISGLLHLSYITYIRTIR